ncbi:hypothetical protein [Arthrobacter mobilis]|nr:hypothetical protein [Arthrobacter mobilis]
MNTSHLGAPVRDISLISRGDHIEARRGTTCYRGRVKDTAPGVGLVWIREHGRGIRRALPADEYSIYRLPALGGDPE